MLERFHHIMNMQICFADLTLNSKVAPLSCSRKPLEEKSAFWSNNLLSKLKEKFAKPQIRFMSHFIGIFKHKNWKKISPVHEASLYQYSCTCSYQYSCTSHSSCQALSYNLNQYSSPYDTAVPPLPRQKRVTTVYKITFYLYTCSSSQVLDLIYSMYRSTGKV